MILHSSFSPGAGRGGCPGWNTVRRSGSDPVSLVHEQIPNGFPVSLLPATLHLKALLVSLSMLQTDDCRTPTI
jgi:hypothetical protein